MIRDLLGTAAGFALLPLAGHGLLRLATGRWPHRAYGPVAAAGLSWFAGVAALGVLTTLVGVLGGPTRPLPVLAPALVLLARRRAAAAAVGAAPATAPPPGSRLGDAIAAAAGVLTAAWVALLGARIPVASNDEYALWMLKARALSQLGELDPRVFTDTAAGYQHQTYPLFLPSLFGWLDGWAGRPTDAAAHLAVAVTVGALLAVAGAVLARLAGPAAAAVALLLVVSVPTLLSRQSLLLVADVPVFAFAFCLALVLMVLLTLPADAPAGPWPAAAAVLGAGAIGTKAEGLAFVGDRLRRRAAAGHRPPAGGAGRRRWPPAWPTCPGSSTGGSTTCATGCSTRTRSARRTCGTCCRGPGRCCAGWPSGGRAAAGFGAVLVVAAVPAAVLAVRAGRWRLVAFAAAVVLLDRGRPARPVRGHRVRAAVRPAGRAAAGRASCDVTVFRVALVPAALLAVAVPLFAGLALRAGRPCPVTSAPEADRGNQQPVDSLPPAGEAGRSHGSARVGSVGRRQDDLAGGFHPVPADEHEVRQEAVPPGLPRVGDHGPGAGVGVREQIHLVAVVAAVAGVHVAGGDPPGEVGGHQRGGPKPAACSLSRRSQPKRQ